MRFIKKYLLFIYITISYSTQGQSKDEVQVDSIFKVNNEYYYANNDYLVYDIERPMDYLEANKNQHLIWNKITFYKMGILWKFKVKESVKHQTTDSIGYNQSESSSIFKWEDIDLSKHEMDNGEVEMGEVVNGKPHGIWVFKFYDEKITGKFNNGLADSTWVFSDPRTGREEHQNFKNGIPHGEWYRSKNGKKTIEAHFNNGKADGTWSEEHGHGKLISSYSNGKRDGLMQLYLDGNLKFSSNFSNGLVEKHEEYKDKKLILKALYKQGIPTICEFYKIKKGTNIYFLHLKINNLGSIKTAEEYYPTGKIKTLKQYECDGYFEIAHPQASQYDGSIDEETEFKGYNSSCPYKNIEYYENGKIKPNQIKLY